MIIIDQRRDYYDHIQALGQDRSLKYVRQEFDLNIDFRTSYSIIEGGRIKQKQNPFSYIPNAPRGWLNLIGFCGRIYPAIRFTSKLEGGKYEWIYSINELDKYVLSKCDPLLADYTMPNQEEYLHNQTDRKGRVITKNQREIFASIFDAGDRISQDFQYLFDRGPIFAAYANCTTNGVVTYNTLLRGYQFMKVADPYSAFQTLQMWISNTSQPEKRIPFISDEMKAQSKGFNKYSFRNEPKSHPKRKVKSHANS